MIPVVDWFCLNHATACAVESTCLVGVRCRRVATFPDYGPGATGMAKLFRKRNGWLRPSPSQPWFIMIEAQIYYVPQIYHMCGSSATNHC